MDTKEHNTIYFAGGCLWGVQEFMKHLPGVVSTQAGRANGTSKTTDGEYDGYHCNSIDYDERSHAHHDTHNH